MDLPKYLTTFDNKPVTRKHQYMFEGKPVDSGTWLELQANDKLRVYDISNHVAMLVEPDTGDYCYVYWDEAAQCSNPYRSYAEAARACSAYITHLMGDVCAEANELNDNMREYGTIDKPASAHK